MALLSRYDWLLEKVLTLIVMATSKKMRRCATPCGRDDTPAGLKKSDRLCNAADQSIQGRQQLQAQLSSTLPYGKSIRIERHCLSAEKVGVAIADTVRILDKIIEHALQRVIGTPSQVSPKIDAFDIHAFKTR